MVDWDIFSTPDLIVNDPSGKGSGAKFLPVIENGRNKKSESSQALVLVMQTIVLLKLYLLVQMQCLTFLLEV